MPMTKNDTETGQYTPGAVHLPRLVVIDESRVFSSSVQEIAEDMGYRVEVVQQIGQVMSVCGDDPPETILIGHVTPERDALQLITWLDDSGCESKVLLMADDSKTHARNGDDRTRRLNLETHPRPLSPWTLRAALRRTPPRPTRATGEGDLAKPAPLEQGVESATTEPSIVEHAEQLEALYHRWQGLRGHISNAISEIEQQIASKQALSGEEAAVQVMLVLSVVESLRIDDGRRKDELLNQLEGIALSALGGLARPFGLDRSKTGIHRYAPNL